MMLSVVEGRNFRFLHFNRPLRFILKAHDMPFLTRTKFQHVDTDVTVYPMKDFQYRSRMPTITNDRNYIRNVCHSVQK